MIKYQLIKKKIKKEERAPVNNKLMLHFGYHKCMTSFFKQIFNDIAKKFSWYTKHHNQVIKDFYGDIINIRVPSIISVNNVPVDFEKINRSFRGTHIIRDPRDLLVSGYRYHLWCKEPWVIGPISNELKKTLKIKEIGLENISKNKSFQKLLKTVDKKTGYLLELNYREKQFHQMFNWNYKNPYIYEIKYENIFNNEKKVFKKIFYHYGFSKNMINEALPIVEKYSFKSLKRKGMTGNGKHASSGKSGQWLGIIPTDVMKMFMNRHPMLISRLGYDN